MKLKLFIIAFALLLGGLCIPISNKYFTARHVSKDIDLTVYKTASYIAPVYESTFATLEVTIVKIKGNKKDTAWQHTFQPKQLKDFPGSDKPMVQKITIPNVNDKKEKLEVYYRLTYNTKGSKLNFLNTTIIGRGQEKGILDIKI